MDKILNQRNILIVGLLFVAINTLLITREFFWAGLVPFALFIVVLALLSMDKLLLLIAFLTPLSVNLTEMGLGLGVGMALPTDPLMFGILLIFAIRVFHEGGFDKRVIWHPISLIIILQLVWMFFTSMTSTMPLVSFKFLISRLWYVVSFYFLATQLFKRRKQIVRYFWAYIMGLAIVIVYTVYQHYLNAFDEQAAHWVMSPFFKDHTSYGALLAFFFPALLGLTLVNAKSNQMRALMGIVVLVFIGGIILSYTRAAWLSLIAALIVYLLMVFKVRFQYILFMLAIVVGSFAMVQEELMMKLEKNDQDSSGDLVEHVQSMSNISTDASNLERINRWKSAWRMFLDKPVMGFGPNTYQFQYAPYQHPNEKTIISTNNADMGNAHSEYLGPLAEQGFLGPIWVLLLVGVLFYKGITLYMELPSGQLRMLTVIATLGLVTYWTHAFLNNFLDTDKASVAVWGCLAVLTAIEVYHLPNIEKRDQE
ncbi:MAG: O-antigen ligase family protein [Flavobacteriales bacterium]|nr:O-antigen ligase family protein [Flavobacteriales bacterium]